MIDQDVYEAALILTGITVGVYHDTDDKTQFSIRHRMRVTGGIMGALGCSQAHTAGITGKRLGSIRSEWDAFRWKFDEQEQEEWAAKVLARAVNAKGVLLPKRGGKPLVMSPKVVA